MYANIFCTQHDRVTRYGRKESEVNEGEETHTPYLGVKCRGGTSRFNKEGVSYLKRMT